MDAPPRLPFRHDLAVVFDAERVGAEHERVLAIVERVEQDLNRVRVIEVRVTAALAHQNVLRLVVEADDADVQILAIEQKSNFRSLGRRLAVVGFLLDESAEGLGV